jgi:integrase
MACQVPQAAVRPLTEVETKDPKANRRRERRMLLAAEWPRLKAATAAGPINYKMSGRERLLLYATAIQTGLRSNELRLLTRGRLILQGDQPYVVCKAGTAKSKKKAEQYILPELAAQLAAHIATKAPKAPVFKMPYETDVVRMLRADLARARRDWLEAAKNDSQERLERDQSDFLCVANHEGEILDFHSLRHTCGAWLSMAGAHPKVVQTVMRHQSITLTMETYGHLFPGHTAEAVGGLAQFLSEPAEAGENLATGTDGKNGQPQKGAQRHSQRAGRESVVGGETPCETPAPRLAFVDSLNLLEIAELCESVGDQVTPNQSSGAGIRTPDTRIMIPLL